jgi:tetratricopeptide (TPR) repeat protein
VPETEVGKLVVRKGDPIAVDLAGSGWIYMGTNSPGAADSAEPGGIDFLATRTSQNRTSFNFKAEEYGDYELTFQYQDHQRAALRSQVIHLQVVPEQDFAAALERQQPEVVARPDGGTAGIELEPGPPIRSADALFELGEYELALIEYTKNMRSGDPYLNDRLAECYERTGEYLAAAKYYQENLGLKGEYGDRAALGLVRSSIATKDSRLLLEVFPSLFNLETEDIGGELLDIARFQEQDRHLPIAIQALEQYVRLYPDGKNLDEVYYRLARIYEVDSPHRDLELARNYYSLLYESFPESRYIDSATERLNYLNRHFFLVQ